MDTLNSNEILLLKTQDVQTLLKGKEAEVIATVSEAYKTHLEGQSSLPQSSFLLFPEHPHDRIIALPAYLGGQFKVAGIKWIASFPDNHKLGLERASAVILLNSTETGRPVAILEGSLISSRRTAASAALAAVTLHTNRQEAHLGIIGSGLINTQILHFLRHQFPTLREISIFDLKRDNAQIFADRAMAQYSGLSVSIKSSPEDVLSEAPLVSLATTAGEPYLSGTNKSIPGSTILHISLRDLTPDTIMNCDNVVDDVGHVLRARTSLHLTEMQVGNHDFIRCTLAEIISGRVPARTNPLGVTIFSPFGLGVLDLAVSDLVLKAAQKEQLGTQIASFLPGLVSQ